ncbi:MAG: FAD-dependent oxidoreductase [Candidatus Micrarchaeia archaeon]
MEYDIIIAGAGMAGNIAAYTAAKAGAKVLLLDRNKEEEVGKKTNWGWVCGDAIAKAHLEFVKKHTGLEFDFPELDNRIEAVVAYSPDLESKFNFEGEGFALNRPLFEAKLLSYAKKAGTEYQSEFEIEGPIIENEKVVGIKGKDKNKNHTEIRGKIVIDALGISTTLRRYLPQNPYIDNNIDINDLELTGRFLYKATFSKEDKRYYDKNIAIIHLNQVLAPGGYGWVFPKSGNEVNIGLGVQQASLDYANKKLGKKENLHSLMDAYAKQLPVFEKLEPFEEGNGANKSTGYWSVSVRRQMESLVYNGYMGAGDSMAMPNPLSAGGIGPALTAGILAGENAVKAIQNGDTSIKGLWQYNIDFNNEYGKKTAALEAFRIYLQSLNNDIINYGFKVFLTAKEAEELSYGTVPELSMKSKFKIVLKGMSNIKAFNNLLYIIDKMKMFNELYSRYPSNPQEFQGWKNNVKKEIELLKERFKPMPV